MNSLSGPEPTSPDAAKYYDAFAETGMYEEDSEAIGWPAAVDVLVGKAIEAATGGMTSHLDLAAGSGIAIEAVKRRLKPERTVAVDASARMLDLLRGKELDGVDIQHETVQRFVEATGDRFDLITFMSAAEFLPNLPVTLHRTARLLNKNGTMLFTYLPLDEGQRPEELIDDTEKLGASAVVHSWPAQEIEWSVTDSGLEVLEHARLADIQPVDTLDYNFMIARKLHAGN